LKDRAVPSVKFYDCVNYPAFIYVLKKKLVYIPNYNFRSLDGTSYKI
jgi:hypothetical protein